MWKVIVSLLSPLLGFVADYFEQGGQWCIGSLVSLVGVVWSGVVALLPAGWVAYLNTTPWETLMTWLAPVQYFLPLMEVMGILAGAASICAAIRLVRWIIALIPGASFAGFSIGPFGGA